MDRKKIWQNSCHNKKCIVANKSIWVILKVWFWFLWDIPHTLYHQLSCFDVTIKRVVCAFFSNILLLLLREKLKKRSIRTQKISSEKKDWWDFFLLKISTVNECKKKKRNIFQSFYVCLLSFLLCYKNESVLCCSLHRYWRCKMSLFFFYLENWFKFAIIFQSTAHRVEMLN